MSTDKDSKRAEKAEDLAEVLDGMDDYASRTKGLLVYQIGRRGCALLFFAVLDLVYGYSLFFPAPEQRRSALIQYLSGIAPLWVFGALWSITGLICLFYAFR